MLSWLQERSQIPSVKGGKAVKICRESDGDHCKGANKVGRGQETPKKIVNVLQP